MILCHNPINGNIKISFTMGNSNLKTIRKIELQNLDFMALPRSRIKRYRLEYYLYC